MLHQNPSILPSCGGDLGFLQRANDQTKLIIVAACPDQGAGNDPEALEARISRSRPYIHQGIH